MSEPAPFACLACALPTQEQRFYCESCSAAGRRMRDVQQRTVDLDSRPLVHIVCPQCQQRSPAYADATAASCLHCLEVVRVADCLSV